MRDRRPAPDLEGAVQALLGARTIAELSRAVEGHLARALGVAEARLVIDPDAGALRALGESSFDGVETRAGSSGPFDVPLVVDGVTMGYLCLERDAPGDDQSERWVTEMCALALRHVIDAAVSSRIITRLSKLEQMSGVGLLQASLDELLATLPERIADALGVEFVRIFLADEAREELHEVASHGLNTVSPVRRVNEGLSGQVMQSGSAVIFDHITDVAVVGPLPPQMATFAGVPLRSGGELIGVVDVGATAGRRFDQEDLTILELAADRIGTALDRSRAFAAERERRIRSDFVAELGAVLAASDPVPDVLAAVATLAVERICDVCALWVAYAGHPPIRLLASRSERGTADILVGEAAERRWGSLTDAGGHSAVRTVAGTSEAVGTIFFGRYPESEPFGPADTGLQEEIGARLGSMLEVRSVHERMRDTALELQRSLLPASLPEIPGIDLAVAAWTPVERLEVGGDFYDVFELEPQRWGVLVGDVSGKGVKAAAMTGIARHTARAASRHGLGPAEVLRWVHDAFISERETFDAYCTAVFGFLERHRGSTEFRFAIGGHPAPILVRQGMRPEFVGTGGTILGLIEGIDVVETELTLEDGDLLLLYTDGVTDVPGVEAIFEDELLNVVGKVAAAHPAPGDFVGAMEDLLVDRYQGVRQDDTVLLALLNRHGHDLGA